MSRLRSRLTIILVASGIVGGCAHYHVRSAEPNPGTELVSRPSNSALWGAVRDDVIPHNCQTNAIDEVRVNRNAGHALVTILTLGLWAPVDVEWRCRKPEPREGETG
jgi:hypothetical protein